VDVFGRTKTPQSQPLTAPQPESSKSPDGKGRPTPSRREAEARNKRPIVGGTAAVRPGATKAEKKAARAARREALAAERTKQREALLTGDDRYLPERDRGPARRFAREYVDARHSAGEYLLVAVLTVLLLSMLPYAAVKAATAIMLYGLVIVVGIDTWLLRRRVQRLADAKFGPEKARGVGGYAMMRALQLRRTRLPRPLNKRGEFPS
jgi:hypothetical protein